MRRWTAIIFAWTFWPIAAWGQEAPVVGSLAAQPGWANFAVVGGRLAVLAPPPRCELRNSQTGDDGQVCESICIKSAGSVAALHYDFVSPQVRLTVEAVGNQRVEIHRTPRRDAAPAELHLVQRPGGELVLTIGAGAARREFSAPAFWRLMLAEPEVVRTSLTPVLEAFRPDWGLCQQTREIEDRLYELAALAPPPEIARWQAWVGQLGDPRFAQREAADRALRAVGQPILPFLATLDRRTLDAEQRARLAQIRQSLSETVEDTPPRVALRLLYDEAVWLDLMARDDPAQRAAAARHFAKLRPDAATFDPQADRAIRRNQLRQLQQQLAHD